MSANIEAAPDAFSWPAGKAGRGKMKKSLLLSPTACKLLRARGRFLLALFPFAFQPAVLLPQDLPRFSAAATQGDLWPWLAALAPLIGIAALIFVLSLREQVKSRNRELALVNEVGQITSELIPLDEMLGRVLAKVAEMMNGVAGAVSLKDGDSSRIAASHRIPPEEAAELLRAMGTTHPICAGETAQVVHLGDQAPLYLRHRGIAATLSVPLIHHDELLGSLCVALQRNENVPAARLETLCGLGRQVALAVIRSRLLEEAQQNLARLTALRDVDLAVSSTLELRDTLRILLEHIRNLPGVVGAAVTLANGDTPLQTLAEQAGLDALLSGPGGHAPLNHLVEQVVAAGSATSISRLADRSDIPALKPLADMQIGTYWGFPLVAGEQVIGVLSVFAKTANGFDRSLHTFLTALSGEAAVAIQNARL